MRRCANSASVNNTASLFPSRRVFSLSSPVGTATEALDDWRDNAAGDGATGTMAGV